MNLLKITFLCQVDAVEVKGRHFGSLVLDTGSLSIYMAVTCLPGPRRGRHRAAIVTCINNHKKRETNYIGDLWPGVHQGIIFYT